MSKRSLAVGMRSGDAGEVFGWMLDAYTLERTGRPFNVLLANAKESLRHELSELAAQAQEQAVETCTAIEESEPNSSIRRAVAIAAQAREVADSIAAKAGFIIRINAP